MTRFMLTGDAHDAAAIWAVRPEQVAELENLVSPRTAAIAVASGFSGKKGSMVLCHDENGKLEGVLFGLGREPQAMDIGKLPRLLPEGDYKLADISVETLGDVQLAILGWCLGAYRFEKYSKSSLADTRLVCPDIDESRLEREVDATFLARDLINTPANDLGPQELENAARKMAKTHSAKINVITGDRLLEENFPMIHAVGRASISAPRLIDMTWGKDGDPKLTLVGKGVIFDTGGLNIKPGSSMALMKPARGGGANVLALAQMVMEAKLPVRLRVLVPAVENAISGNAFRPGDVLQTRKGITVEIGNTDAEGRLILGDALTLGDEEAPQMMIDMATLTGAARVALGPDLPPFYTHDDDLADQLLSAAMRINDPLWRMPLWAPYKAMLSSSIADINHITSGGFAGSVTAALFLEKFVDQAESWVHFDIFGWVPKEKPWAQVGGEAQCIRAIFSVLENKFK